MDSPLLDCLGLGTIQTDKEGFITVDEEQNTNVPRIYALGDVTNNNHTV